MTDAPLSPDTVLVRAPELLVRLTDDDDVRIELPEGPIHAAPVALALLAAFEHPTRVADALESLPSLGAEHFMETSEVIVQLYRVGILRPPTTRPVAIARGFVSPTIHIAMLGDRRRTDAFCDALAKIVTKDDVVVDIGTGTGILASRAALAGARKVYAIESSGIADFAEKVFASNALSAKIDLVRARSTQANLPERGTVLVTEIIGNEPFHEDILEVVLDAKQRLLTDGARLVPARIELLAMPVAVPPALYEAHAFTPGATASYREAYGVDLSALLDHRLDPSEAVYLKPSELAALEPLAAPVVLADVDLADPKLAPSVEGRVSIPLEKDALHLGVIVSFRATLAPGITLSPLVPDIDRGSSWMTPLWPAWGHAPVRAGQRAVVEYTYRRRITTVRAFAEG